MCGIIGYTGEGNATDVCLQGLKKLSYRGYDSAGIGGFSNRKLLFCKEKGKVSALETSLQNTPLNLSHAIGHTRWATHGIVNQANAHPHFDQNKTLLLVHNGIIENYLGLKTMLQKEGYTFHSETDTEVLAQLIAHLYNGDPIETIDKAQKMLQGIWAFALTHKEHPEELFAAAHHNPLLVGTNSSQSYLSSDLSALSHEPLEIIPLSDKEIIHLKPGIKKIHNTQKTKTSFTTSPTTYQSDKNGYEHFMLKEIEEQPAILRNIIENPPTPLSHTYSQVIILACGTSWHAGLLAASWIEENTNTIARAEIASEFRYKNLIVDKNTLIIAISQSGETLDTLLAVRAAKEKGAKILALCNVPHSALTREADTTIYLNAGPEISVCSTKAFTAQLLTLYLLSSTHTSLRTLPTIVEQVLSQKHLIEAAAKKYARFSNFLFLGKRSMVPVAYEAALKLKEISYFNVSASPSGEMKHGTIALVDKSLLTIALCGEPSVQDKLLSNIMEIHSRQAPILLFAPNDIPGFDTIIIPDHSPELNCILYSVATQLFAYYIAKEHDRDIDQPRNLAKSVTVE